MLDLDVRDIEDLSGLLQVLNLEAKRKETNHHFPDIFMSDSDWEGEESLGNTLHRRLEARAEPRAKARTFELEPGTVQESPKDQVKLQNREFQEGCVQDRTEKIEAANEMLELEPGAKVNTFELEPGTVQESPKDQVKLQNREFQEGWVKNRTEKIEAARETLELVSPVFRRGFFGKEHEEKFGDIIVFKEIKQAAVKAMVKDHTEKTEADSETIELETKIRQEEKCPGASTLSQENQATQHRRDYYTL